MNSAGYRSNAALENHWQSGVGLIEVLIAVVLISMGFLAAARMQVEGMRFSQSAYFQSQAYFLASDMIDRMRSNIPGVARGHYSGEMTSAQANNPQCDINECLPLGIAQQDIYDWSTHLHPLEGNDGFVAALPSSTNESASGQILDLGDGIYAILMSWNEVIGGDDVEQSFRIQFALEEET